MQVFFAQVLRSPAGIDSLGNLESRVSVFLFSRGNFESRTIVFHSRVLISTSHAVIS